MDFTRGNRYCGSRSPLVRDTNTKPGLVLEALPGTQFKVEVEGKSVICYLAGKMFKNFIKVIPGDKVDVVLAPDGRRGRIVKRK